MDGNTSKTYIVCMSESMLTDTNNHCIHSSGVLQKKPNNESEM